MTTIGKDLARKSIETLLASKSLARMTSLVHILIHATRWSGRPSLTELDESPSASLTLLTDLLAGLDRNTPRRMVRMRSGSGTGDDTAKPDAADKENVKLASAKTSQDLGSSKNGSKRKSGEHKAPVDKKKQRKDDSVEASPKIEKSKSVAKEEPAQKASRKAISAKQTDKMDEEKRKLEAEKPRLTTPDIEFEYDRSKLRDPRATPGRVRKPQYDQYDVPPDVMAEINSKFHIPKPEKPKGRLNSFQKDEMVHQEGLMNPLHSFHASYTCQKKGRSGSPTYDSAGFELDWSKLDDAHKRNMRATKSSMVNGMERHLERVDREQKEMFQIFFKAGTAPGESALTMEAYIKDHVSKDLAVPWHQIGPDELRRWEAKGFEKQDVAKWWHEPNEEEEKRMLKMLGGSMYRKDL